MHPCNAGCTAVLTASTHILSSIEHCPAQPCPAPVSAAEQLLGRQQSACARQVLAVPEMRSMPP